MRFYAITAATAAAFALTACGGNAGEAPAGTNAADATRNTAAGPADPAATEASGGQAFANTAAASDAFEIETSKLALATSKSAAVKKFAQKMIDAHTASTAKLKTAAAAASPAITPDPMLTTEQRAKLDALKGKTGADFDTAYVTEQTAGHQMTLDALRAYSASGEVPSLKAFATESVPTVAAHLNMAKSLKP